MNEPDVRVEEEIELLSVLKYAAREAVRCCGPRTRQVNDLGNGDESPVETAVRTAVWVALKQAQELERRKYSLLVRKPRELADPPPVHDWRFVPDDDGSPLLWYDANTTDERTVRNAVTGLLWQRDRDLDNWMSVGDPDEGHF